MDPRREESTKDDKEANTNDGTDEGTKEGAKEIQRMMYKRAEKSPKAMLRRA